MRRGAGEKGAGGEMRWVREFSRFASSRLRVRFFPLPPATGGEVPGGARAKTRRREGEGEGQGAMEAAVTGRHNGTLARHASLWSSVP